MLQDVFIDIPFQLTFDDIGIQSLLKACNVKIENTYDSFLEKIINYINILIYLKNISFVVFVNLKSVLNDDELAALYKHCLNEKIKLLLLESYKSRPLMQTEKAIIITEDLCEIVENYF